MLDDVCTALLLVNVHVKAYVCKPAGAEDVQVPIIQLGGFMLPPPPAPPPAAPPPGPSSQPIIATDATMAETIFKIMIRLDTITRALVKGRRALGQRPVGRPAHVRGRPGAARTGSGPRIERTALRHFAARPGSAPRHAGRKRARHRCQPRARMHTKEPRAPPAVIAHATMPLRPVKATSAGLAMSVAAPDRAFGHPFPRMPEPACDGPGPLPQDDAVQPPIPAAAPGRWAK